MAIDHNKILKVAEDIIKYYINTIKDEVSFMEAFIGLTLAFQKMENSIKTAGLLNDEQIKVVKENIDNLIKKGVNNEK